MSVYEVSKDKSRFSGISGNPENVIVFFLLVLKIHFRRFHTFDSYFYSVVSYE